MVMLVNVPEMFTDHSLGCSFAEIRHHAVFATQTEIPGFVYTRQDAIAVRCKIKPAQRSVFAHGTKRDFYGN